MVDIYNSGAHRLYGINRVDYLADRGTSTVLAQIKSGQLTVEQIKELNSINVVGAGEFENHGVTYLSTEYRKR